MKKLLLAVLILLALSLPVWILFSLLGTGTDDNSSNPNLRKLLALPYLSVSSDQVDTSLAGVTRHVPERVSRGYNFFSDEKYAYLMDLEGRIVHRWHFPTEDPEWEHVEYLGKGDILANCNGEQIVRLDRDSNVIWSRPYQVHHDIAVNPDGTILVPIGTDYWLYRSRLVQFDSILRLNPEGEIEGEWSAFSCFDQIHELHPPLELDQEPDISGISSALKRFYFRRVHGLSTKIHEIDKWCRALVGLEKYDYYHLNTVEVLPETELGKSDPRFAPGNILVCLRHADLIMILDRQSQEIVWSWGPGIIDWPHMPTMLEEGNILIYDNGTHRDYSRVLELDPVSKEIVWEYRADPPQSFHSLTRGSNQRLPNGNTLICEAERGRVFEITPEKEVVWEFYNPDIREGQRRLIYRMERLAEDEVNSWLGAKKSQRPQPFRPDSR